jgi:hypothetical protein
MRQTPESTADFSPQVLNSENNRYTRESGLFLDAFGVLGVVDRRDRDQLAVELDGEVLQRLVLGDTSGRLGRIEPN